MKELVHRLRAAFLVEASALDCFLGIEDTQCHRTPIACRRRVSNIRALSEFGSNLAAAILDLDRPYAAALTREPDLEDDPGCAR